MQNEYYDPVVTAFKNLFNAKDTPHHIRISILLNRIQTGNSDSKVKIERIRASTNDHEIQEIKKSLPALMFNGKFNTRNEQGIIEHSGLCIFDFDKYESEEVLNKERLRIQADKFTYACFLSPSGKGLKVLVKIPKSSKEEHYRRFHAYKNYINSDYFDDANSNLSRVCFDSYDQRLFWRPESKVFESIEAEEEKNYTKHVPVVLLTDTRAKIERIMKFDFQCSFVSGSRSNYIFKVACCFCEYDISKDDAESYLLDFQEADFKQDEIIRIIRSAYKKSENNTKKFFENNHLKEVIKKKIKEGNDVKEISKELNVGEDSVKDVKKEVQESETIFWKIKKTRNGKEVEVINNVLRDFLASNGFNKYYPEKSEKFVFVKITQNKVKVISSSQIKDFILNWLDERGHVDVWNMMTGNRKFFQDDFLNFVPPIDLRMLNDTKDVSYIPYQNGILEVKKESVKLIQYLDIDLYVWENQIINRDFESLDDFTNDFQDLVSKVTNEDQARTKALESTIGYLIHAYKDKTHQKAVIFNDQEIDDNPNGGSGKSLLVTALSKFRNVVKIDGKHFNPMKSDFVYQRVNLDTQILAFDDVKRNFEFEQLFAIITEGITVNRKNKDEIFIPFDRSPKVVITTNYVIAGAGESHDRRRHEIEFYQYFHKNRSPLKIYGKLLFDQWNSLDWSKFDNYMIYCLQLYLKNGLIASPSINVEAKRFISSTCKEFFDFMHENFIELNKVIYNSDAYHLFIKENRSFKDLDTRKFIKWVDAYCLYKGYKLKKGKDNKGRWLMIVTKPEEEDQFTLDLNN